MNSNQVAVDVGCVDIRFDLTGLGVFTADELVLLVDGNLDGQFNNEIPIPGPWIWEITFTNFLL